MDARRGPSPHILARAEERWKALVKRRPELSEAVALQRQLLSRASDVAELLQRAEAPLAEISADRAAANISCGVPALSEAPWGPVAELAASSLADFCTLLAEGGAGEAATHLLEALSSGRVRAETLVAASLARNHHMIACGATDLDLSANLVWLVGELAAAPVAVAARERLVAHPAVASAIVSWPHGYCPFCGSWPAFAEKGRGQAPFLRCSFCAAAWPSPKPGCIYCGTAGDMKVGLGASDVNGHRIDACDACQHYLKSLAVDTPTPPLLLAVEDLATVDLDEAAAEAGYTRPPLPDLHA